MEDKLTLFRQQAAIISRKKESTAEKLNDVRVELAALEDEVKDKKSGTCTGKLRVSASCREQRNDRKLKNKPPIIY